MALLGKQPNKHAELKVLTPSNTGEMHFIESGPGSWFNLPRAGGVAYAAQESWVMNDTIKASDLTIFADDHTERETCHSAGKYPLWLSV